MKCANFRKHNSALNECRCVAVGGSYFVSCDNIEREPGGSQSNNSDTQCLPLHLRGAVWCFNKVAFVLQPCDVS